MTLSDLFSLRYVGAKLGLLAAFGTSGFLVLKLLAAAAPAPTAIQLINSSLEPMALGSVQLNGKEVGPGAMLMPAMAAAGTPVEWVSKPLDLDPGRPVEIKVVFAASPAARVCTLEARPQGACVVKARFEGATGLACEFDCKPAAVR